MKVADPKTTAGRAFIRSLNILLKFARLYGYDHIRTVEHLDMAWRELRTAIPSGLEGSLLLGATGINCYWMVYHSTAHRRKSNSRSSFRLPVSPVCSFSHRLRKKS